MKLISNIAMGGFIINNTKLKYIIILLILSVILNIFIFNKLNLLQNNQATLLANLDSSIPDIKDFDRPVEVFVLIEKFINYYNSENYEKIKSLWLTKEINAEFDVSPAKDNVILTFNHRYGPKTVYLPKDCFKEIKFNSFVLYKTGFSSIGLYTDYNNERKYLLFDITKNKEDKYCINGIEVKDDAKQ